MWLVVQTSRRNELHAPCWHYVRAGSCVRPRSEHESSRKSLESAQVLLQRRRRRRTWRGRNGFELLAVHMDGSALVDPLRVEQSVSALHLRRRNGCSHSLRNEGRQEVHHLSPYRVCQLPEAAHGVARIDRLNCLFGNHRVRILNRPPAALGHYDTCLPDSWPHLVRKLCLGNRQGRSLEVGRRLGTCICLHC